MPPDPPRGVGPCGPFSGHSPLLHLQWLLITKVIETPVVRYVKEICSKRQSYFVLFQGELVIVK